MKVFAVLKRFKKTIDVVLFYDRDMEFYGNIHFTINIQNAS